MTYVPELNWIEKTAPAHPGAVGTQCLSLYTHSISTDARFEISSPNVEAYCTALH